MIATAVGLRLKIECSVRFPEVQEAHSMMI